MKINQLAILSLILLGLGLAVFLVGQRTFFKPKATLDAITITHNLSAGWNLISTPMTFASGFSLTPLAYLNQTAGKCNVMLHINPVTAVYEVYSPTYTYQNTQPLSTIKEAESYFVFCTAALSQGPPISGTALSWDQLIVRLANYKFNRTDKNRYLLPLPYEATAASAQELVAEASTKLSQDCRKLLKLDSGINSWVIYERLSTSSGSQNFPIDKSQGYLLECYPQAPSLPTLPINQLGFDLGVDPGAQSDTSKVDLVTSSKAKWARLNFIGSNWSDPNSADVIKYNQIINAYTQRGVKILGLIGAESVAGGYDQTRPNDFIPTFVNNADMIINNFGDRVKTFELFNEPNDYAGGSSAQLSGQNFAKLLSLVYRQVKITHNHQDIKLISGPIFAFDLTTGADYLNQTYQAGKADDWEVIRSQTGSYPLDGIGYHLYVSQGRVDTGQVEAKMNQNLTAMKTVIDQQDPGKQIVISEFGWGTGVGRVDEDTQAANLEKAVSVINSKSFVRVALWFSLQDWNTEEWGLVRGDGTKKKAWNSFTRLLTTGI